MLKLAVLVSGRGSNFKAIAKAIKAGELQAEIVCLLSNKATAGALEIAREYNIPALVVPSAKLSGKEHDEKVLEALAPFKPDYLVLAGYMRILTSTLLQAYKAPAGYFKVINIHPSLLPAFPGKDGYGDAFAAEVAESGITVHLVDEEVDHGPIVAQQCFPRLPADTLQSFRERGLAIEHKLFPLALQLIATRGIDLAALPYVSATSTLSWRK